ncbi:MAG TPA: hypothetical protein VKA32_00860 [Gammaproteobacteria bacterium]|nr:hypothetical protein [Gammaproteobacteria bacterium]
MGLLDYPAPVFSWLDAEFGAVLPPTARLVLWGVLGGILSMALYRWLSPQRRIAEGRRELADARRRLDHYDGDFSGAWPIMANLLRTAGVQVARTGWPAVIASIPLLCLLLWLSTAYGYRYPESDSVPALRVTPAPGYANWVASTGQGPPGIEVADARGGVVTVPLAAPVPVLHHRHWWNALAGNPAGYLPGDSTTREVAIALPPRRYLPAGPAWLRGWELPFFLSLVMTSLVVKRVAHIE